MIKKSLIIVVFINSISIIQSCCTEEYRYEWTGFEIAVIDNSGEFPELTNNKQVDKNAFGFRITFLDTVYLAQAFKLINACYATSCAEEYTRIHNLSSVKIKTIFDYSQKYAMNSDVSELFRARETGNNRTKYISIGQMISKLNESSRDYRVLNDFDLYLIDTASFSREQQFEIVLSLSDGTSLQNRSDTLVFH
jgi:hypothetical protein